MRIHFIHSTAALVLATVLAVTKSNAAFVKIDMIASDPDTLPASPWVSEDHNGGQTGPVRPQTR